MITPESNLLLDALSSEARAAVLAQSKLVSLPVRASIQSQEELPRYAYFMVAGVTSVVINLPEGGSSETALIGREGVTGALSLLGSSLPPTTSFVQVEGAAYRLPFPTLRQFFDQSTEIRSRILEHVQQVAMSTSQVAACNNAHDAESRLARWLLMVQDRTGLSSFYLTQETLAEMLGTRRSTVAVAAGTLQRSGFIEYSRGHITILSREALEGASCDCYPVICRLLSNLYR